MRKKLRYFVVAFLAMVLAFHAPNVSALQLSGLEPQFSDASKIELNTPADGYDFDATLLDQNLTLQYQATVTNDESDDIVITSIGLTNSSQSFISYSYDSISTGDIMAAGTSRQINIYIKTNDQPTRTIDEDFDLTLNYRKSNQPVNPSGDETNPTPDPEQNPETPSTPNTFDNIAVVALLFAAVVAIAIIVIRKNGRIRHLVIIFTLPLLALLFPAHPANAATDSSLSITGQVHFINSYTLTINPNGGEYAGDLETVHREGSEITIQDPTRATYKFDGWTAEGSPIENGKITITEDTTLTANWSEIYYSLTINPNGGEYNHSTSTDTDMVRAGERVSLLTPTKTGATFRDWTKNGTTFTDDNFIIEENTTLIANYDDIFFDISVDPNGGLFHDRDDLYTDRIKYGDPLDLTSITPISHYELYSWTRNGSETLSADTDSINIFEDTNLVANWRSTRFFDVTINPNGGEYKGTTENDIKSVREFEEYTIDGANPLREGYLYLGWILEDGSDLPSTTFTVYRPIEIRANWMFIAARNERTQTLYPSITAAAEEAQNGDTITVLADFEEKAHINKNITLDLNGHTISGYLINDGNVTLLNGEINSSETTPDTDNPNGAAIVNYGTLTLGIDDYEDSEDHVKSALVDNNYVRIIGTTVGLQQNGTLNYYDGYIEGDVALSGGYNDSPWYRDTFDGIVVRHFPFVDHNNVRNCQHVILENSDNAVSKTVDNGEIYYYNLQDNINTSIRTGYKIYAVRDFDAGYTVTVPENTDIAFDVASYNVTLNDTITIDGKFTIEDSATRISTAENAENVTTPALNAPTFITPHGDTITTATYAGSVSVPQTIINNGELVIKNAFITGTTGNDTIRNLGTLSMEGGIIGATTGYVTQLAENSIYNLDDNSYIYSASESKAAVYNELNDYTWSSGNIAGRAIGFHNKGANVTISDVTIIADNPSATSLTVRGVYQNNNNSSITLSNANVIAKSVTTTSAICGNGGSHCTYGVSGPVNLQNHSSVTVTTTSNSPAYGISGASNITDSTITINAHGTGAGVNGNTEITRSDITVTSEGSSAYGAYSNNVTINSGNITVKTANSGVAGGIYVTSGTSNARHTIKGGTVTVKNQKGKAYGIYGSCSSNYGAYALTTMTGGTFDVHSEQGIAYGVYGNYCSASYHSRIDMSGGSITANSDTNESYGINASGNTVTGGKVEGGKYGIYSTNTTPTTLGNLESAGLDIENPEIIGAEYALYGGSANFYDGVLRGQTAYQEGVIKAIPDGATFHNESSADYDDNCWLVNSDPYLFAGGQPWSSLADAYAAITPEDPTIKVIDDAVIEAVLPASPDDATVIFDLNGHSLTYTQPLINNGTMTIVDDSPQKTGVFKNTNPNASAIQNNGTLTVNGITIEAAETAINNANTLTVTDTTITTPYIGIYSKGVSGARASMTIDSVDIASEYMGIYNYQYSTATVSDSTVTINNTATAKTVYGVNNYSSTSNPAMVISNTSVSVTSATTTSYSCDSSSSHCTYGVYGSATISDSDITVTTTSSSPAYGTSGTTTLTNSDITVNAYGPGYGASGNTTVTSSNITVTSENSSAYAINSSNATVNSGTISATAKKNSSARGINSSSNSSEFHINGGTITAQTANGSAYGIYGGCSQSYSCMKASMSAGAITASSVGGIAYGVYGTPYSASKSSRITLTGGTITASSNSNDSYGINASGNTLLGGIVKGGTYGLYGNGAAATAIGDNDSTIDVEHPEIIGGAYALNGGSVNFYDGILKGGNKANQEGVIKTIAANAAIYTENQIIDGANYEVRYLTSEGNVAEINGTGYLTLSSAVEHAQPDDVIDLVAENYLFAPLEIDSEKKFTIRTNGYGIHTGHPIINDGDVQLINNSSTQTLIEYTQGSYFIQNHANAHFHLQNFQIEGADLISNAGSFTMESVSLNASDIALHNTGELHAQTNMVITGSTYPIYNDSGDNEASISNATLTGSEIYNASGTLTLRNSTTTKTSTSSSVKKFITNEGTMNLDSFTATFNINPSSNGSNTDYTETIYNLGTLNISGNSNIQTIAASESYSFVNHISTIYNNGGTVTIDGTTITTQTTDLRSYSRTTYGIYNPSGNVTVKDATVESIGKGAAYGIWNTSGIVTLGEAEPVTSINYGGEHADVSVTSPLLKASTTSTSSNKTAIAIKNDTGKIYYYDGKAMGQTAAMPDNPAGVEYLYEPKDFVEDGYQCRILEWMREQPSNQP